MSNRNKKEEPRKFELISLVDVVFLLLIFFLVTLNFGYDKQKPGDGTGIYEGSLLEIKLPDITNKNLKTANDSLIICLDVADTGVRCYLLDSNYSNMSQIQSKIVNRLMELKNVVGKALQQESEGRRLYRAWHSHVVTKKFFPGNGNIKLNNWSHEKLEPYLIPVVNAIQSHGRFKKRLNQTITEYLKTNPGANNLKFSIAAHRLTPYRLVYDILEVLDEHELSLSNIRMTKKSD